MKKRKVFIIAEAGVNHNGDLAVARKLVDVAKSAGADAVKFQAFKAEFLACADAPKALYQKKTTSADESQLEMLKRVELDAKSHKALMAYCREKKIMFLSSPFDLPSIDMLFHLGLRVFKIPSGEITNLPYLEKIGRLRKKVILSSGMSDLDEIKRALNVLIRSGTLRKNITVMHCNTEYPTPFKDVHLHAMPLMKEKLRVDIGYSDHSLGIEVALAAVALGAVMIEKHVTLDKNMPGPDHKASLLPDELKTMVKLIRNIESALGDSVKAVSPSERRNIAIARKSIVASETINAGELFTENNLTVKRPGTGVSPMQWYSVVGRKAKKDFFKDELITL